MKVVAACLLCVLAALLAVGVVSGTLVRHVIQVLPIAAACLAVRRFDGRASWAAVPIFAFWLAIMVLIWLFLLGIARVVTGTYSPAEIALTIVIGVASAIGLVQAVRAPTSSRVPLSALLFVAFGALQVVAMWCSLNGPWARG
jgi:hypothetical protein